MVLATGAGAIARQTIGWSVLGRYAGCNCIRYFHYSGLFILIIRLTYGKKKLAALQEKYQLAEQSPGPGEIMTN